MSWEFREEAEVLEALGRQYAFPDDYFVIDVETCGFSFDRDFIVDVGWAVVVDRKITDSNSLLLDWSQVPADHGYIQSQLLRLEREYAQIGRPFYYPWERLCDEGVHPLEALHTYATLIYDYIQREEQMVGHGLWRFDRKMIDSHTHRFLQEYKLPWRLNSILDTGVIEKAAQASRPPYANETLDEWSKRVNNANIKGVKWNLEMCSRKYRLIDRYQLDASKQHTGDFDCVLIHYQLETFRQLAEILNGERHKVEDPGWSEGYQEGEATHGQAGLNQGPQGLRANHPPHPASAQTPGRPGPGQ